MKLIVGATYTRPSKKNILITKIVGDTVYYTRKWDNTKDRCHINEMIEHLSWNKMKPLAGLNPYKQERKLP